MIAVRQAAAVMTIGALARAAGVNVQTVRYYERRGLLPRPARTASGYRTYTATTLERLRFIRRAQELGFSLSEVGELLALRLDPSTTAAAVKASAERKIEQVEARIEDLRRIRHALTHLAGRCRGGRGPIGDCPLMEELQSSVGSRQSSGVRHQSSGVSRQSSVNTQPADPDD